VGHYGEQASPNQARRFRLPDAVKIGIFLTFPLLRRLLWTVIASTGCRTNHFTEHDARTTNVQIRLSRQTFPAVEQRGEVHVKIGSKMWVG
jgi:hypothetical protein